MRSTPGPSSSGWLFWRRNGCRPLTRWPRWKASSRRRRPRRTRLAAEEGYAQVVYDQEISDLQGGGHHRAEVQGRRAEIQSGPGGPRASAGRRSARAEQALAARIGEEHALVAEAKAELAEARLNLEWTRIYAPANGYVTNVQLREGFYVHAGVPVLTFIDSDQWWVVANYRENSLETHPAGAARRPHLQHLPRAYLPRRGADRRAGE